MNLNQQYIKTYPSSVSEKNLKALRKLKHPSRSKKLKSFAHGL